MGIESRDYYRERGRVSPPAYSRVTPVVKWLLILNVGIALLDYLILPLTVGLMDGEPILFRYGAFSIGSALGKWHVWEFFTFQFMHGGIGHLAMNGLGLFFFGPWMERWWGSAKFLVYYLLCGAAGAALFTILTFLGLIENGMESHLVGASAGIYGILIGVAVIAPNLRVALLFPPVELSMRQLAIGLLGFSVVMILLKLGGNEGGEAGHLGGAVFGWILMRFPWLLGRGKWQGGAIRKESWNSKLQPRSELNVRDEPALDAILEKISRDGLQSLTDSERELLREIAERQKNQS